jgi:hypothetical protein
MYKRLTLLTVALLVIALFLAAFEGPPNRDRPLVTFVGKETCKVTDSGRVEDKETVTRTMNKVMQCYDDTNDPMFTGPVELTLKDMWNNTKANGAGWGWYEFKLKGEGVTWIGWRVGAVNQDGVAFTNGWGYAKGGPMHGRWAYWRFTDETPSVIHGWYEETRCSAPKADPD